MIGIGAIFRDEYDYLLEWFAWHRIAGFQRFLIADNSSSDGTTALLEAFFELGLIQLIYQPVLEKRAQIAAYARLSVLALHEGVDAVLYIDADEFLVHESLTDGEERRCLENLLEDPRVGMVGINWRTFGSSGHTIQTADPVIYRFIDHATNASPVINGHLKSIVKIACATKIGPHISRLQNGFRQINVLGEDLVDYIAVDYGKIIEANSSGITRLVTEGPLRVHHYVIKSEWEYFEKKRKRGSAMRGIHVDKGVNYFKNHDFKDEKYIFPEEKINRLRLEIDYLRSLLVSTVFGRKVKGTLDLSDAKNMLSGWLVDDRKLSEGLKVNIFVNGVWQSRVACGFYRPDLKKLNISVDGFSGFRYFHPKPLLPGEVLEVKVHANRYIFPGGGSVTII